MKKISKRQLFTLAGAAGASLGGLGLLAASQRKSGSAQEQENSRRPYLSAREAIRRRNFPNVDLITHEGEKVRFYDDLIKDKFVTINMIYATCQATCPLATANLMRVQKLIADRVGRDLFMYTITIDPEHDTADVLKEYAANFGIGKGWTFLTGKPADITFLRRRIGFAWSDPKIDSQKDFHTGNLRYGNEPSMLWGAVPTLAEPKWIERCILFADSPENHAPA